MQIENRILNKHTLQHKFYFLEVWAWVMVRINAFWMKKVYTDTKLKNIRLNRKVEGLFLSSISIKVHLLLVACHVFWWTIATVSVVYDIISILVIKIAQKYQSFHKVLLEYIEFDIDVKNIFLIICNLYIFVVASVCSDFCWFEITSIVSYFNRSKCYMIEKECSHTKFRKSKVSILEEKYFAKVCTA